MNASKQRKLEEIERTLAKLIGRSQTGIPIIVEGRKDKDALRQLKILGKIVCLKARGDGFYDFASRFIDHREVTVLTDFDGEGVRLAAKLIDELSRMKVKVDLTTWKRLKALSRSEIRSVEELADYVEKLRLESASVHIRAIERKYLLRMRRHKNPISRSH